MIRFEDLIADPKKKLMESFRFLLSEDNLEGTVIEALINRATYGGDAPTRYKPRKGGG